MHKISRESAITLLSARYGQLISVDRVEDGPLKLWTLSRLKYRGDWTYDSQEIDSHESLYALVFNHCPGIKEGYDEQFDIISPQFIQQLAGKRKAERAMQGNVSGNALQADDY